MRLNMSWLNASEDKNCISMCDDQTHPMPATTQKISRLLLTKLIPCRQGHTMNLNICWQKPFPFQRGHKTHLNMCWPNPPMPPRMQNVSQLKMTKPKPCQRGHKMHLNPFWRKKTLNISHLVLTKPLSCAQGDKMHLHLCSPNPLPCCEDTEYISTCDVKTLPCKRRNVDQNPHFPARSQNVSQHVFTKPFECQRGQKMYHNLCRKNPFHESEDKKGISTFYGKNPPNAGGDTKCNSTSVDLTHAIPAWAQNVYQLNPSSEPEMHLNM